MYLEQKANAAASRAVEDQRTVIQKVARQVFQAEAREEAANLGIALGAATKAFRRSMWSRLVERDQTAIMQDKSVLVVLLHDMMFGDSDNLAAVVLAVAGVSVLENGVA